MSSRSHPAFEESLEGQVPHSGSLDPVRRVLSPGERGGGDRWSVRGMARAEEDRLKRASPPQRATSGAVTRIGLDPSGGEAGLGADLSRPPGVSAGSERAPDGNARRESSGRGTRLFGSALARVGSGFMKLSSRVLPRSTTSVSGSGRSSELFVSQEATTLNRAAATDGSFRDRSDLSVFDDFCSERPEALPKISDRHHGTLSFVDRSDPVFDDFCSERPEALPKISDGRHRSLGRSDLSFDHSCSGRPEALPKFSDGRLEQS